MRRIFFSSLIVADEGYSRNASYSLNLISTFYVSMLSRQIYYNDSTITRAFVGEKKNNFELERG